MLLVSKLNYFLNVWCTSVGRGGGFSSIYLTLLLISLAVKKPPGGWGYSANILVGRLSTSFKNGPNRIWQGSKKGAQLDWKLGKRESIGLNINTMRGQSDRAWMFEGFEDAEKGTQTEDWKSQKHILCEPGVYSGSISIQKYVFSKLT